MEARQPSPSLLLGAVLDRVDEPGELRLGPRPPPRPAELGLEPFGEVEQVADVVQGVAELRLAEGRRRQSVRVSPPDSEIRSAWFARLPSESG
ncbi:MAG: hypothetical protein WKF75_00670 [Singulisphaera sp.]